MQPGHPDHGVVVPVEERGEGVLLAGPQIGDERGLGEVALVAVTGGPEGVVDHAVRYRPSPRRVRRWSATRRALAMMVRVGFTAELEGKKPASTT